MPSIYRTKNWLVFKYSLVDVDGNTYLDMYVHIPDIPGVCNTSSRPMLTCTLPAMRKLHPFRWVITTQLSSQQLRPLR